MTQITISTDFETHANMTELPIQETVRRFSRALADLNADFRQTSDDLGAAGGIRFDEPQVRYDLTEENGGATLSFTLVSPLEQRTFTPVHLYLPNAGSGVGTAGLAGLQRIHGSLDSFVTALEERLLSVFSEDHESHAKYLSKLREMRAARLDDSQDIKTDLAPAPAQV